MRLGFLLLILIAVLFGSGFWYRAFDGVCDVPIRYHIGEVDERFGTDREELKRIAGRAERIWEDNLGRDIFVYDEKAKLPVNLVFDERQKNADIEAELREDLEAKEGMTGEVATEYDRLIAEFRKLKRSYESRVATYETKLESYNSTVAEWNGKGGAPESAITDLRKEEGALREEQGELESLAEKLNGVVAQLNAIGARGNLLIEDYNTVVEEYNSKVEETGEFTQGDYTRDAISVYQFNSEDELVVVLAHEFGHALALGHVENEKSIMYHLMEAQRAGVGLTEEDTAEFERVCAETNILVKVLRFIGSLVY
jgi:predicted Zn-dependent protease